jgi:hypothetical protein
MESDIKFSNPVVYLAPGTRLRLFVILIIAGLISPGCKKSGLFMETGETRRVSISIDDFEEIILNDKINLFLTYDTTKKLSIEAGENLIPGIGLSVRDGKLSISDNNNFQWSRNLDYTINVFVSRSYLKKITYYGAGNIKTTNTWKAEEFILDSWTGIGSADLDLETGYTELVIRKANADFTLRGSGRNTMIYCADHGSMNLEQFTSGEVVMDYRSIRDSRLNVTQHLDAKILYKGNVYYKGNPSIASFYNSTGKLIAIP